MPSRSLAAVAAAVAVVCPAYAETRVDLHRSYGTRPLELGPSLRISPPGRAKIDRASLALRLVPGSIMAKLTLAVSTTERRPQDIALPLGVPHGTKVTGLAITFGESSRVIAKPIAALAARERYREIVGQARDPVLLEYTETTALHDQLAVRVFPLSKQDPATIEIEMELPPGSTLDVDPGVQTIALVDVDVSGDGAPSRAVRFTALDAPQTIELGDAPSRREWMTEDTASRAHVDETTSLFSGVLPPNVVPFPMITISTCGGMGFGSSLDKTEIRRFVKLRLPRLEHCYMLAAQRDPTLEGEVLLHFAIEKDGSVTTEEPTTAMSDPSVAECIGEEMSTWRLRAGDTTVVVNYPLTFKLDR